MCQSKMLLNASALIFYRQEIQAIDLFFMAKLVYTFENWSEIGVCLIFGESEKGSSNAV